MLKMTAGTNSTSSATGVSSSSSSGLSTSASSSSPSSMGSSRIGLRLDLGSITSGVGNCSSEASSSSTSSSDVNLGCGFRRKSSATATCGFSSTSTGGWTLFDSEPVDPAISLEKQSWYHGCISRGDAEDLLRSAQEGSYLVRSCESKSRGGGEFFYSLSLKSAKGFMHMKIVKNDPDHQTSNDHHHNTSEVNASTSYTLVLLDQSFPSIPEMIHHYSLNRIPIKGAEHMSLRYPVTYQLL